MTTTQIHISIPRLSKSKVASFEHCPKRLWMQIHRRSEARFDEPTLARFQFGHDIGRRAQSLEPDGVLVETGRDMDSAIDVTRELIHAPQRRPIFEATFVHANVLVRVDILRPLAIGWEAIEVKASSRVHSYHLADLATQIWVMRGAGLEIPRATIRHLAYTAQRPPDIDVIRFTDTDVTPHIERFVANRANIVSRATCIASGPEPQRSMGRIAVSPLPVSS